MGYTMTASESAAWESDDARVRDAARREIRARVARDGGGEIYSADGVTMDAIDAAERTTLVVDSDTVSVVLDDADLAGRDRRATVRAAIDEIARRMETEIERRGLGGRYEIARRYDASGARSTIGDAESLAEVWDVVLIGQGNEIRAAVLGDA
jgi:hypothetical protein